jgi:hypothetical protein
MEAVLAALHDGRLDLIAMDYVRMSAGTFHGVDPR